MDQNKKQLLPYAPDRLYALVVNGVGEKLHLTPIENDQAQDIGVYALANREVAETMQRNIRSYEVDSVIFEYVPAHEHEAIVSDVRGARDYYKRLSKNLQGERAELLQTLRSDWVLNGEILETDMRKRFGDVYAELFMKLLQTAPPDN